MERRKSLVANITAEEYFELIADAACHMAELRGFKAMSLKSDWQLAEKRILNVISNACIQFDGNTRLRDTAKSEHEED